MNSNLQPMYEVVDVINADSVFVYLNSTTPKARAGQPCLGEQQLLYHRIFMQYLGRETFSAGQEVSCSDLEQIVKASPPSRLITEQDDVELLYQAFYGAGDV